MAKSRRARVKEEEERSVEGEDEEEEEGEGEADDEDSTDEEGDGDEEGTSRAPGRGPQPPRISVTLPARIRRKVRIAAAKHDMEVAEWCKTVIVTAAVKTMERYDIE